MSPDSDPAQSLYVDEPDLPLSTMQAGILTEHSLDPDAARYNVPLAFEITGPLDGDALARAIDGLVDRNEILRTIYRDGEEGPIQAIAPNIPSVLRRPSKVEAATFHDRCRRESGRPFDLSREPPVRAVLFQATPAHHALCMVFHHIAVDGWSIRLILDALSNLYDAETNGTDSGIAEPDLQYADWAGHQHDHVTQGKHDAGRDHVLKRFNGVDLNLDWPSRGPRSGAAMYPFTLDMDLVERIESLARQAGTTSYSVLAGAFSMLVSKLSGEKLFLFGTPVVLRDRPEVQEIVGCFVNTVPVRVAVDPVLSVEQFLGSVSRAVIDALDAREVPFDMIARRLARDGRSGPILRAFFNFDDAPVPLPNLHDCSVSILDCDRGTAKFDLMLSMLRVDGQIRAAFDVATDVFPTSEIAQFEELYRRVLAGMVATPEENLGSIGLLRDHETAAIVELGQGETRSIDEAALHGRVLALANRIPGAPAVRAPDGDLDFNGLRENASSLAELLNENGIGRGDRVVVLRRRGVGLPVSMLASMVAGAGYVPIEPSLPDARLEDILRDAAPGGIVCDEVDVGRVLSLAGNNVAVIAGRALQTRVARRVDAPVRGGEAGPDDLAYMIYTSGSTGRPKGVMVPHRGVINYLDWSLQTYGVDIGGGTGVVTSSAFDATVLSFWAPLLAGKPLDLLPEDAPIETLSERLSGACGYGFVKMTPAHLDLLAELSPIETQSQGAGVFVVGGEALTGGSVAPWRRAAPRIRIFNEYGPTETVVGCCVHEVSDEVADDASVPIGRPIANTNLYVLDNDLNLVPRGVAGELHIGGAGVAWGYWRRAALTSERFLADPFSTSQGARMYRTGDLVLMRDDGVFDYLGRVDDQVKIRGYRIEPGEIETALRAVDGVRAAAVIATGDGPERRLIGYVVGGVNETDLKSELATILPSYMVPDRLIGLEALPLTSNDKIDRRRLAALKVPDVQVAPVVDSDDMSPVTAKLTELWSTVLKADANPNTDFFAAGGTSLSAIRLIARLKSEFSVQVGFPELVETPTPCLIATRIVDMENDEPDQLEEVLKIVRDASGMADLGPDQDLLALGMTSLKVVRVTARLRRQFGAGVGADTVFSGRTPRGVAILLSTIKQTEERVAPDDTVTSPAERQLWLDGKVSEGGGGYVMQAALTIRKDVDTACLDEVVRVLGERHPILSGRYEDDGKELRFRRMERPSATYRRFVDNNDAEAMVRSIAREDATRQFALEKGETWRLGVIAKEGETIIVLSVHHIVSDATSLNIILRDLIAVVAGSALTAAPEGAYRAYTAERDHVLDTMSDRQTIYWRDRLVDPPGGLELPTDRPRRLDRKPRGGSLSFDIPATLVLRVDAVARAVEARPHAVFMAAYAILLHRLTEADDLIVGIPVNLRPDGFDDVVGLFLNTLPLRVRLTPEMAARDLVREIAEAMTSLLGNADLPLSNIVKVVNPPREPGRTPLLHTVLDWREDADELAEIPDVKPYELEVANAPLDLAVTLRKKRDGSVRGGMIFDAGLLDQETVAVWARSMVRIVESVVADVGGALGALSAIAEPDLSKSIIRGAEPETDPSLLEGISGSFNANSDRPALETADEMLTYSALWQRSATRLNREGSVRIIDTADPLERVVEALAALRCNQAIALIDPSLPPARVERMRRILAAGENDIGISDDDAAFPAYVQFTSGSTGLPKAAALSRRGLANLATSISRILDIGPGARVAQVAAPAFDAWIWEVFSTLRAGGTLILADREDLRPGAPLARTLATRLVSHVTLTPSALAALGEVALPSIRVLVAAGEPLSGELVDRWAPGRRMYNAYGPCEATVCSTIDECRAGMGAPTIGRPIDGMIAMILDRRGIPVVPGASGELSIGGIGVGLGYFGAADLTAERFVQDPRPGEEGITYRSGDVVRVQSDGRLRFVGRDDRQVKVRGVRIELDEVEIALGAMEGVDQAAVRVVIGGDGQPVVAGWVSGPASEDVSRLRDKLSASLPETMMPSHLMAISSMPMTATGKVDRDALPNPNVSRILDEGDDAPIGPIELAVAEEISAVLGLAMPVGRDTAFFTIGGHSLLAIRLATLLSERLGRAVPLPLLFAHSSPASLAAALTAQDDDNACTLRVLREGTGESAYFFHAVDGTCQAYLPLAEAWSGDARIVAVEQLGPSGDLNSLAKHYTQVIQRDVEREGTGGAIRLVGWSLGATIAAAVADNLRLAGQAVAVVLIDAGPVSSSDAARDEAALIDAAREAEAGPELVERVRGNMRLAASFSFDHIPGAAGLIKANQNVRDDKANDLGWAEVFARVKVREFPGAHMTILRDDPKGLANGIEMLWVETGDHVIRDD
jgi:amino acid adenylation domain-containing protein